MCCHCSACSQKLTDDSVVGEIMTKTPLYTCQLEDSVEHALELLVLNKITGLPVINKERKVVSEPCEHTGTSAPAT